MNHPNQWNTEEIYQATALRAKGKTYREIAAILGRSKVAIRVKLKRELLSRLGISSLPKGTKVREIYDKSLPNPSWADSSDGTPGFGMNEFVADASNLAEEIPTALYMASAHMGEVNVIHTPAPAPVDPLQEAAKKVVLEFGRIPLEVFDGGDWTRFGLVSDTHLCCKEERLDALHAQYDLFAAQGITTVFHAGNIVDGYVARINGGSVFETTIDGQAQYVVDNYPQRKGITTHFITGDDHESWFAPGFNFGAYLAMLAKSQGRTDLNYIGHVEADVELKCGKFSQVMKIQHPGGGSAYARSYKGQKMVESFQGGEKPAILVQGHYHVSGYSFDRNVHIVGMPGFQDQTIFGRKKHLRFEIGGCIIEFKMNPSTGAITRFRPEFNMWFDRGFYKPFLKSDSRIIKGHLIFNI